MKKVIQKQKMSFKKGDIVHLDNFLDIAAFVQVQGRSEAYKSDDIRNKDWDADMADEYRILQNFTVEVKVTTF